MRRTLIALIAASAFMGTVSAQAQTCTSELSQNLRDCVVNGISSCATAVSECEPLETVLSLEDVREVAINACCDRSSRARRRVCLARERRKYLPQVGTGDQRQFFLAARDEVSALRDSDCNSNGYQDGL